MLSLKSLKTKYIVQLILTYTTLLISVVVSSYNVLPKFSVDYKLPTLLLMSAISILYSYILLLKNYYELKLEEKGSKIKELEKLSSQNKHGPKISLDDYQFVSKMGYYKHRKTDELFCSPCLLKNVPAQLKEFDEYFRCVNCGEWYYKPGFEPNKKSQIKKSGDNWVTDF